MNVTKYFIVSKNIFNWSNEIFDGDIVIKYLLIQLNFFLSVYERDSTHFVVPVKH